MPLYDTLSQCLIYSSQFQLALGSGWLWPKVQAQGVWAFDIYGLGQPWIVLAMNRGVRNAMLECLLLGGGRAAAANQRTRHVVSTNFYEHFAPFLIILSHLNLKLLIFSLFMFEFSLIIYIDQGYDLMIKEMTHAFSMIHAFFAADQRLPPSASGIRECAMNPAYSTQLFFCIVINSFEFNIIIILLYYF
jgi:hypothetical protein